MVPSRFALAAAVAFCLGAAAGTLMLQRSARTPAADDVRVEASRTTPTATNPSLAAQVIPQDDPAPSTTQALPTLPVAARPQMSFVDDSASSLLIEREDVRKFRLTRPGSTSLRVTFLTPDTFRIHVLGKEPPLNLPEYMLVKSDDSYPPVQVTLEAKDYGAVFRTEAATISLLLAEDGVLVNVATPAGALVRNWKISLGRRTAVLDLGADEHIYGFGDKRAALDQRGNKVEMLNRDAFASESNESYKSIPFYVSSSGYGLFFHNFYPSVFDVGAWYRSRMQLSASAGDMDFYVFVGDPKQVIAQYTELTGRPAMLPRWAFGYHQAKASYEDREAFTVASEMRKRKLPLDVIYYDGWDDKAVAKSFIDQLWVQHHVRLTVGFGMPMFGRYPGTDDMALLGELGSRHFLMTDKDGRPLIAPDQHVDSSEENSAVGYVDFFSAAAVDHVFKSKWSGAIGNGVILGMVDFGELDHISDAASKFWPSLGMSVAETRNLYGLVYPLSIMERTLKRSGGRSTGMVRPGFAGTQRLGWSTTGDSVPTYRNFRAHTRAMINLTLSGFSNVGQDIGGWDKKGPDVLYARWFAAGAFHPFMWSHGQGDHEPYAHGEEVEQVAREFLNLRYRLVPYFYSLHELAHRTGVPLLRSFPLQESADPVSYRVDDQYFIGDDILVAPLFNDAGDRKVYLPKGLWYDFFNELPPEAGEHEVERTSVPLDRLPVYVRAGAVIPLGPTMQYTAEKPVDPLTVDVYSFGAGDTATQTRSNAFELYEDDGRSNDYQSGKFQRTRLRFVQSKSAVRFEISAASGDRRYWAVSERAYVLRFHGVHAPVGDVLLDGQPMASADGAEPVRSGASWRVDNKTGDVVVSIPKSSRRAMTVEFGTAPAWTCSGPC